MNLDSESFNPTLNPQLRALQIIVAALASGPLAFLLLTPLINPAMGGAQAVEAPSEAKVPVLIYIGLAAIVLAIAARVVLPRLIESTGRKALAAERTTNAGTAADRSNLDTALMMLYQRRQIVAVALIEIGMKARCSQGLIEHLTQTLFIRSNEQWTVYRYP